MARRSQAQKQAELGTVRKEFARWRRTRDQGARIPQELWDSAVALARNHGISKTSQSLHLDYYSLQAHLEAATRAKTPGARLRGSFVELPLPPSITKSTACVLEFEDGHGVRLHLEFSQLAPGVLESLVSSLWRLATR